MMGDQWGRHGNMKWYTPEEFVAYMDDEQRQPRLPAELKMMQYRTGRWLSDIPHEHIASGLRRTPTASSVSPESIRSSGMEGGPGTRARGRRLRLQGSARASVRVRDPDQRA